MTIRYVKHKNVDTNNIEFLFVSFDYYDGIELISKFFHKTYRMKPKEIIDGIWYKLITLVDSKDEYSLYWHEDVGNYIFSVRQDDLSNERLEMKVHEVVAYLNTIIKP